MSKKWIGLQHARIGEMRMWGITEDDLEKNNPAFFSVVRQALEEQNRKNYARN